MKRLALAVLVIVLIGCSRPALHKAIEAGDMAEVRNLIEVKHADPYDTEIIYFFNAFQYSIHTNNLEAAKYLMDRGVDIYKMTSLTLSPLCIAPTCGNVRMTKFVTEIGFTPNPVCADHGLNCPNTIKDYAGVKALLADEKRMSKLRESGARWQEMRKGSPTAADYAAFVSSYPDSTFLPDAEAALSKMEVAQYDMARKSGTADAWLGYLKSFPQSKHRAEALKAAVNASGEGEARRARLAGIAAEFPDAVLYMSERERLGFTGPADLPVYKIAEATSKGIEEEMIISKIRSSKGAYKEFTLDEMLALREMGISKTVIDEMMATVRRADAASENAELKAEIERLRKSIEEMQARQASGQPVQAGQSGQSAGSALANCASQLAALEVCKEAPGGFIGQEICKAAAKSQFPCQQ